MRRQDGAVSPYPDRQIGRAWKPIFFAVFAQTFVLVPVQEAVNLLT